MVSATSRLCQRQNVICDTSFTEFLTRLNIKKLLLCYIFSITTEQLNAQGIADIIGRMQYIVYYGFQDFLFIN